MSRIIWSAPAAVDLDRIDDWLTENRPADFTLRTIRAIRERADWLGDFPHGGRQTADGFRIVRARGTRYLIIYQIAVEGVEVVRVLHEREDRQIAI